MTLIAAIEVLGTPVLIGDLLISIDGTPAGTRRKLVRMRRNFAIGWAGSMNDATLALQILDELLPPLASLESVEAARRAIDQHNQKPRNLFIVGWILQKQPRAVRFSWDPYFGARCSIGSGFAEGSGAAVIRRMVPKLKITAEGVDPTFRATARHAGYHVANLMADEFAAQSFQRDHLFGSAYEVLVSDGERFRYASPNFYAVIRCEINSAGEIESLPVLEGDALIKTIREHAIVQKFWPHKNHVDIELIDPIDPFVEKFQTDRLTRLLDSYSQLKAARPCRARPLYFFVRVVRGEETFPPAVFVIDSDAPVWNALSNSLVINLGPLRQLVRRMSEDRARGEC